jgi:hypothetical protein
MDPDPDSDPQRLVMGWVSRWSFKKAEKEKMKS